MAEIKYFLSVNPNYPECKNCHILDVFKNASGNHNIVFKSNTENIDLTRGTLIIKCDEKSAKTIYFSTKIRFPRVDKNTQDKNFIESAKVNISKECPAVKHLQVSPIEPEIKFIKSHVNLHSLFEKKA